MRSQSPAPTPQPASAARVVSLDGLTSYCDALELQYAAQAAVQARRLPHTLYLLEHPPVVTIGRSCARGDQNLITSRAELSGRGIDVHDVDRGGQTTYHAPGQLVGYSIVNLSDRERDLHGYVRTLERIVIGCLCNFDVRGDTIPGLTGVWIAGRKIAAVGVKVSRWVTMHGFAINYSVNLDVMRRDIVPCGISDRGVVSLHELGARISRADLEQALTRHWLAAFAPDASAETLRTSLQDELTIVSGGQ